MTLFVLFLPLWPLACLCWWLLRHLHVMAPTRHYGRRKKRGSKAEKETSIVGPWRKPEWVRERVMYYAMFRKTCRDIAKTFNSVHGWHMTVSHMWVHDFITEHAEEIAEKRRAMRRRKPILAAVGHTWALDLTFWVSSCGLTFTVLGIIDSGSRRLLCLKLLPRKCALTVLGYMLLTMAKHGVPRVIWSDNERMFRSYLWVNVLGTLGIKRRYSLPRCPWQNGVIERLFLHCKTALKDVVFANAKALKVALYDFQNFYNAAHRHTSLGGRTPMEAWHGLTMADVQRQAQTCAGRWVQALNGALVGHQLQTRFPLRS